MTSPRWAVALLRFVAPPHREDDVLGDLEESHRARLKRRGAVVAWFATGAETLDVGLRLFVDRLRRTGPEPRRPGEAAKEDVLSGFGISWLDFKLGLRMLLRFPGLTFVAGLAIAFAIGLGASSFEFVRDAIFPRLPFEGGLANPELGYEPDPRGAVVLASYLAAMTGVCALACIVPARRALAVQPTDALRAEG